MALETGVTYIDDLVATNPVGATDNVDEGDDHIRNIKTAVKGSFPSLGNAAVTKTSTQINDLATVTGAEILTNKTLTSPVINTAVSGTAILDEDDLTTDSDTQLATQQSIKAYVDAKTAALNTKIVEIGTWDMDATATVGVAHGVTWTKIRSVFVLIRSDVDNTRASLDWDNGSGGAGKYEIGTTNIALARTTSGIYDSTDYDTMGGDGNRGYITIQYID